MSFTIGVLEDERVTGLDGANLAAAVSAAMHERAAVAYVASLTDVAQGVVACSIAGEADAPLLLTERSHLPGVTVDELRRLGASAVVVVGSEQHVATSIEETLRALGLDVRRIADTDEEHRAVARRLAGDRLLGSDHFARSVALAVASFPPSTAVFVSTGDRGVVLHAPDAVPVPAGRVIDALAPSVVAVLED